MTQPPVNPFAGRRDERSGPQLEGAMIVQSLMTAFAFTFLATAALGHVLLLQAAFAPSNNPKSGKAAERTTVRLGANHRCGDRVVGSATLGARPDRWWRPASRDRGRR